MTGERSGELDHLALDVLEEGDAPLGADGIIGRREKGLSTRRLDRSDLLIDIVDTRKQR